MTIIVLKNQSSAEAEDLAELAEKAIIVLGSGGSESEKRLVRPTLRRKRRQSRGKNTDGDHVYRR